jgi:hypothetical protein
MDGVVDFLRDVMRAADRGDLPTPYGVFSRAYLRMTLELIARIGDGGFDDAAWLARFVVDFAERYRVALVDPGARVGPWRIAMESADRAKGRTIKHLVLGINAHMAYDLAMVLAESAIDDPRTRFRDYARINTLLAHAIDPIGKILGDRYGRWIHWVDRAAVGVDELVGVRWFLFTRERAWRDALAIRAGTYSPRQLDARVSMQARLFDGVFRF